ncbi:MAG: hypothetical protein ACI4LZ_09850, partial [Anaerovoracaceae bacterium]
ISYFDVSEMKPRARDVIEIFENGKLLIKRYAPGSRRIKEKQECFAEKSEVGELCAELRVCIDTADRLNWVVDDTSAELTIYHNFGRVEKVPRELGDKETDIYSIMYRFLSQYKL